MVVVVNYRLGPLGFPQGKEAEEAGVLNLGLRDVKVALDLLNSQKSRNSQKGRRGAAARFWALSVRA